MPLQAICIEVRKNLRCVNVFLRSQDAGELQIKLDANVLRLQDAQTISHVLLNEHINVDARSLSNLIVTGNNISFRLVADSFEDEKSDAQNGGTVSQLQPNVVKDSPTHVYCFNCECDLTGVQQFSRILEFPSSDNVNISEFFCHHHPSNFGDALVPAPSDLFFGFNFVLINRSLLIDQTKEIEGHVYCARCFQYLGETLFVGKAAKLWADAVSLQSASQCNDSSTAVNLTTSDLILKLLRDHSISAEEDESLFKQIEFSKIVVEASFPNRRSRFLLLNIVEKHVSVLREATDLQNTSTTLQNGENIINLKLRWLKCIKLFYRYLTESDETKQLPVSAATLLSTWQSDISIQSIKVSPTQFAQLFKELSENSLLLPEIHRDSGNKFMLSFIFYT